MTEDEMRQLAALLVRDLSAEIPKALVGSKLPTFDISGVMKCCEDKCPCNSKEGCGMNIPKCGCEDKCGCHGKTAFEDPLDMIARVSRLPAEQIKTVFEASTIIQKMRGAPLSEGQGQDIRKQDTKK